MDLGIDLRNDRKSETCGWKVCHRIFNAGWKRVESYAEYVKRLNDLSPEPREKVVSEVFLDQEREILEEIEREWVLDRPDLARFKGLVADWEDLWMTELRVQVERIQGRRMSG